MESAATPKLSDYDFIAVNSSAGKDSQTALRRVVYAADDQGFPRERIIVVHADLGEMEWPGTRELAEEQAKHYGLRFEVVKYRTKNGEEINLLEYARRRGKWPSSTTRYCTSEFKRGPCLRVLTKLQKENGGRATRFVNVYGFRAEESPARRKKPVWEAYARANTATRSVWNWLPIHTMTEVEVWADIKASGVRHHWAYDLGMPRLSCRICIFSPHEALLLSGIHNPELLQKYVDVEKEIGHDFQHRKPLVVLQNEVLAGKKPDRAKMNTCWGM